MSFNENKETILASGTLTFTIESRILRELGERLVKQPEVAILELIKNAYDADSGICEIRRDTDLLEVSDDGHGMTLERFQNGWMRVGTSSKEDTATSQKFGRVITGEKGIGRFAVRFLGRALYLETIAYDESRSMLTKLTATFDWPLFDRSEDLGDVRVPFELLRAPMGSSTGTTLQISLLRPNAKAIKWPRVMTSSLSIVTPYASLLRPSGTNPLGLTKDEGFRLKLQGISPGAEESDLAHTVLDGAVLRAVLEVEGSRLRLNVYRRGSTEPSVSISDEYENSLGSVFADIRFFPQRKGTFTGLGVDGREAKEWVKGHSGIAVFDRDFRVHPYGDEHDDWLMLAADTARRAREPVSSIARQHLPMEDAVRQSTQLNYMLRLPYPQQIVGIVQVEGRRSDNVSEDEEEGLYASADREGFVNNAGFRRLQDLIRGAVESIAFADRELQLESERTNQAQILQTLRDETREAINEIESNPNIRGDDKSAIISRLARTLSLAEEQDERLHEREADLETMSLLGVVAGFMTHEFGGAFHELEQAHLTLTEIAALDPSFVQPAEEIADRLQSLREFVTYSQGYVRGAGTRPEKAFPALPRIKQVLRVFGNYARDRGIDTEVDIEPDTLAPLIPVSLYNGLALNLFTNALKAVTAKSGDGPRRILFRAWNDEQFHWLEASDTGIGIPSSLRHRVFDPLFTTTGSNQDPLGSGMGLGLSLVKRGVQAFGGKISVVDPPEGFTTCFKIRLPLGEVN